MIDRSLLPDDQFIADMGRAFAVEQRVAWTCKVNGAVHVIGPEYQERPTYDERGHYRDQGDLFVKWTHDGPVLRYEVKWRKLNFTGPHDYPHPTIFVDEVANMNAKGVRPDAYIIVNRTCTHAVRVKMDGAELTIEPHWDSRYHQMIDSYSVPRSYATGLVLAPPYDFES